MASTWRVLYLVGHGRLHLHLHNKEIVYLSDHLCDILCPHTAKPLTRWGD